MITEAAMFAYLMVFLRAGAMLLAAPVFGATNTPVTVRIFTAMSLSMALTFAVTHGEGRGVGPMPTDTYGLVAASMHEVLTGLLIGAFMSLALQVAQMAGALMDFQVGLGSAQLLNPTNGIEVSVLSQYKFMLGVVIFLATNAHLMVIRAFVHSYDAVPGLSVESLPQLEQNFVQLSTSVFFLAIQIAAPVLAVSLLLDGAFGLISRAVPQMQIAMVGLPAKIALGLVAVSFGLPALAVGVTSAVNQAVLSLGPLLRH